MEFMQIIEYTTSQPEAVDAALDEFLAQTAGKRTSGQGFLCRDRDTANRYVNVIVFPSHQEAMRNNEMPETQAMAEKMMKLCDGPPTFHNLDVLRTEA
jgi:hypothetical protein